jgi:hypothetical protein
MTTKHKGLWRAAMAAVTAVAAALSGCASGPAATAPVPTTAQPGAVAPTTRPAADLVAPTYALPTFPLVARDVPTGLGRPWVGLSWGRPSLGFTAGRGTVTVVIFASRPDDDPRTQGMRRLDTKVGGAGAVVSGGDYADAKDVTRLVVATCRPRPDQWVRITSTDALIRDGVLRLGRGLRPGTTPGTAPPVTLSLVPAGQELVSLSDSSLCLAPRGALDQVTTSLCVSWGDLGLRGAQSLTVRGQRAELLAYDNVHELRTVVRPKLILQVTTNDLTRQDTIRIAEGITFGG